MNPHGITHQTDPKPLTGNCAGLWRTFDSIDPLLAGIARALCDTCPLLTACREQRDTYMGSSITAHASVEGTWAGRTYGTLYTKERRAESARRAGAAKAARDGLELGEKRTHCLSGHPFDDANTYVTSNGKRQCRACRNAAARAARERRKAA